MTEPTTADEQATYVNEIVATLSDCSMSAVASELRKRGARDASQPLWPLVCALEYAFDVDQRVSINQLGPYSVYQMTDGTTRPPLPDELGDSVTKEWSLLAASDIHPIIRGRLHDLLWVTKTQPRPDLAARGAAACWAEGASMEWGYERIDYLVRALDIANEVNDADLRSSVSEQCLAQMEASLDDEDPAPGFVVPLAQVLVRQRQKHRSAKLGILLVKAAEVYGRDPWILQDIQELRVLLANGNADEIKELRRDEIKALRQYANTRDPLSEFVLLHRAAELARRFDVTDLLAELLIEIETADPVPLQLVTGPAESTYPAEFVEAFVEARTLSDVMELLVSLGPACGELERNQDVVVQQNSEFPLQAIFPTVVIGPKNTVVAQARTEDEEIAIALIKQESQLASLIGHLLAEGLRRCEFGNMALEPQALVSKFIPIGTAERVVRAITLFTEGRFDDSVHILVPRLESMIRSVCSSLNIPITKITVGEPTSSVRTLGDLLFALDEKLNESWLRTLRNLLVELSGRNLRNRIAHGLIGEVTPEDAALMLHIAAYLFVLGKAVEDAKAEPK